MKKKKNIGLIFAISALIVFLGILGWFINGIFEGEHPVVELKPLPEFLSKPEKFSIKASDKKRGIKLVSVSIHQEGREIGVLEQKFPFTGLLNNNGSHEFGTEFMVDPNRLNLSQGRVDMKVKVWDYSRRGGGDGNLSQFEHKMLVDTIPPALRAISRMHYINIGGSGLVVYQTSSDTIESGLFVSNHQFKGYSASEDSQEGLNVCYFAVPHDLVKRHEVYLWAKDRAGNQSKANFYYNIRKKRFRTEKMNITDRFLQRVLPYFSDVQFVTENTDVKKFLKINRELREENAAILYDMKAKTADQKIWDGKWLRLKNAATMARFADKRLYYYKGKKIDEQFHLGIDLASLANSDVPAANNGRVIHIGKIGIYGLTVVLDHGQGIASIYCHLSSINTQMGADVLKGETIGTTGQTGLAGGDHLHFGIMVGGIPVNPIEWWDSHWIKDNITRKLALIKKDT